jgi:hypothetical protein
LRDGSDTQCNWTPVGTGYIRLVRRRKGLLLADGVISLRRGI